MATNAAPRRVPFRRTRLFGLSFFGVFLVLTISAHLYLLNRLVLDTSLHGGWRLGAGTALLLLGACVIVQPFLRRRPGRRYVWLSWLAYVWFGLSFVFSTLLLLSEIPVGLALWAGQPRLEVADLRAVGVTSLLLASAGWGLWRALGPVPVRRVDVELASWPPALDGFRIVQLSDLHLCARRGARFARAIVRRANRLGADLIVLTGDLVDGSVEALQHAAAPLGALRGRHGAFFVTGNHDHYSGADAWCAHLARLGLTPLRNTRVRIEAKGAHFELAGVDDHRGDWTHGSTCDLAAALSGWDRGSPLVLLAHDPATFPEAARAGVDLQLSGHTHGGQIWPFHGVVRAVTPFVAGLFRRGVSLLYVSRGTGYWGPPLRIGAPAEITELVLRSAAQP